MRVVENNKMNLALKENLKWSTVCDEIEEIDLKGSNHEHESEDLQLLKLRIYCGNGITSWMCIISVHTTSQTDVPKKLRIVRERGTKTQV
jgi:hypothetical protein